MLSYIHFFWNGHPAEIVPQWVAAAGQGRKAYPEVTEQMTASLLM
jgi:hypothetical protein